MIIIMLDTMWGHFLKSLDMVHLIKMEMVLQVHWLVNRSQGFFLWDSEGSLRENEGCLVFELQLVYHLKTYYCPNSASQSKVVFFIYYIHLHLHLIHLDSVVT